MEPLGDDELFSIFEKVSDTKSFVQVSKQFMKVACIRLHKLDNSVPDLLYDILPKSSNLVSFRCSKPLSNNHMQLLANSCPNLSELWLALPHSSSHRFDFDDDGLCAVANACSKLCDVDLRGRLHFRDVGIHSLVTLSKNLSLLDLHGCVNITDQSLKVVGEASCLRALDLKRCYLITDLGLQYLANGNVKNSLHCLNLARCNRISDYGIIYLKQIVNLECLNLANCGNRVTDSGIMAALSQLPIMKVLDLSWLINITDISLLVIATKCLKLECICFTGCQAITGQGLRAFSHHPCLEHIELLLCHNFSWEEVKSVALTCPQLQSIDLSNKIKMSMPNDYVYEIINCDICWK